MLAVSLLPAESSFDYIVERVSRGFFVILFNVTDVRSKYASFYSR
jgi:hypothetical protein